MSNADADWITRTLDSVSNDAFSKPLVAIEPHVDVLSYQGFGFFVLGFLVGSLMLRVRGGRGHYITTFPQLTKQVNRGLWIEKSL